MNHCYKCGDPLDKHNKSKEHIIPNHCGGKISSYDLLCEKCINELNKLDNQLYEQLEPLNILLPFKRDRKKE